VRNFHLKNLKEWCGKAGIIFVEKISSIMRFYVDFQFVRPDEFKPKLLFVMSNFNELEVFAKSVKTPKTDKIYFLLESKENFELKTFEIWTEKVCNIEQLVTLNAFDKNSRKWQKSFEIQEKFTNFHGCELKVFSGIFKLPTFDLIQDAQMTFVHPAIQPILEKRDQKEEKIVKIFSEFANFTAIPGKVIYDENRQVVTASQLNHLTLQCSIPVFQYTIQIMYSPPEPYSNYEKMILPFDSETWLYLILVFLSSFIGIFLINRMPKRFKDLFYGKNVRMPSLNVLRSFFGIGQTKLPHTNFGRIILMTFIMFCLIFRTAYQG
jgi:hypothetical protein